MSFPENKKQAIALLYVQSRDLSEKTASEILKMYEEALRELNGSDKKQMKIG